jgi:hypothetical protein
MKVDLDFRVLPRLCLGIDCAFWMPGGAKCATFMKLTRTSTGGPCFSSLTRGVIS